MSLLSWIKSRFEMAPINRVAEVRFDENALAMRWAGGSTASVAWDDLVRVLIRTTDCGPFDDDVFFVLETAERCYIVPQQAVGAGQLLERLQGLPGFDNEAVIESMTCCENKEFLCWQRG